jgi:two-component system OmpR family sensor kinase
MNLRTKVVLIASGLTLLGLLLGLGITYELLVRLRLADLDADNKLLSEVIAGATLAVPKHEVPPIVESYLVRSSGVSAAQVYAQGRLLWEGSVLDAPEPLDPEGLLAGGGTRTVGSWRVFTFARDGVTVQVGRRLNALRATLQPLLYIVPPLVIGLSLLSGLLAWVVAGVALRPLKTLTLAARGFTDGAEPPDIPGSDEATTLAKSFSALLARLKEERQRERRFLAYAAHELRTPISALRASLEAVRLQQVPLGPERRASAGWLERLHREALRLETFAQNLLALSRAEASEVRAEAIDLADLVSAAYDRFQPLALETGHELALEAETAPLWADSRLLEQALNNLLSNAIRHTPTGQITFRSGVATAHAYIEVVDAGTGLPEGVREGLGLRVIRSVVVAHGGTLTFSYRDGTGARLELPVKADL